MIPLTIFPALMATASQLTALLILLLPLNALQIIQFLLLRPLLRTYGPTNSAASPECLTNDPIPSLTATATLLTALLTLLLPMNALQMDPIPSLTATGTQLTALLILLLTMNAYK
jgi:hypothetical protein